MHVDGFRFDLAAILSRDERGSPAGRRARAGDIAVRTRSLAGTQAHRRGLGRGSGLMQVGHFVGERWKEWNGSFRDDVRRFCAR
jgi:glycogen operon protein